MSHLRQVVSRILCYSRFLFSRIEKELLISRGYGFEPGTKKEVNTALSLLPKNLKKYVFFDIGANYGEYSEQVVNQAPDVTVHAFEPSPQIFEKLSNRFKLRENVKVHPFGISNFEGQAELYSDDLEGTMSSLVKRNLEHLDRSFDSSTKISVNTLDNWCEKAGIFPDLIKIDVEGFEFHVLEGARKVLPKAKVIQFEFGGTNIDSRIFFRDFWMLFSEVGFDLFLLTPNGLSPIVNYSEHLEIFIYSNYYAVNRRFQ